jgi:hypothetical protein
MDGVRSTPLLVAPQAAWLLSPRPISATDPSTYGSESVFESNLWRLNVVRKADGNYGRLDVWGAGRRFECHATGHQSY